MNRLNGKVALVTGAAAGMGEAHARAVLHEGAQVILTDISVEAGQRLADELGTDALFLEHDVTDPASWESVVSTAVEAFGPVTILVNNAGLAGPQAKIVDLPIEEYLKTVAVDQHGVFLGMRAVIPGMIAAGGGTIVNISSVAGFVHQALNAAYTAAKFAVRGMTKAAAIEYAAENIRVNSVHPGAVWTPMLEHVDPDTLEAFTQAIPMQRMAQPHEVSQLVVFLASDESSYITGAEHIIDGGALAD